MDKPDGGTPRITSIAVRFCSTSQTKSFSIHKIAEQKHMDWNKLQDNYDICEREMLKDFFKFVREHKTFVWLHWNMRDENYGFYALENRFKVLGGTPICVEDNSKIDIARLFVKRYGKYYIQNPKIVNLVQKNGMSHMDFLTGQEEADAFVNREYIKLHKSTLRKVDLFSNMLIASAEKTLKTNAKWKDMYGVSPQGLYQAAKDNIWYNIAVGVVVLLLGAMLGQLYN